VKLRLCRGIKIELQGMFSLAAFLTLAVVSSSADGLHHNAVIEWSATSLRALRDSRMGAPMATRAVAIAHTCMYDAWAAYDDKAVGTQLSGVLRRPTNERTLGNKEKTVSYAAYRALSDVLPADTESVYKPLMKTLGYDPNNNSTDIETPEGIGNVACAAVLEFRHHDKANQLGDMQRSDKQDGTKVAGTLSPYGDWTSYTALNAPGTLPARATFTKPLNPDHWQPLTYTDSSGNLIVQMFSGAQWPFVTAFAFAPLPDFSAWNGLVEEKPVSTDLVHKLIEEAGALRSALDPLPAKYGTPEFQRQAEELILLSAKLTDEQKMLAEFWTDNPGSDPPVAHWMRFAEFVSARDHRSLDDDVKIFFALSNALMDADIATWDAKRYCDSVRPATAIPLIFRGKTIKTWGGPGKGTVQVDGGQWLPYQSATLPTPPSPDYVSETSAESSAAAHVLALFTGSDRVGYLVTTEKGSSKIEPGVTPGRPVSLRWETFDEAAVQAGLAGRYAGIHFAPADLAGRKLGRLAADRVWSKAKTYFNGNPTPSTGPSSHTASE
jgi:Domain of unknown function (DUF6851)/VCPO second helical-bundle domain